jgi:putative flavoprotein involved in K+ transport
VRPKELAAAGVERVPRTVGVRDGFPLLEDGRVMEVATVLWCTGFRPEFAFIDLPVFDHDGLPLHHRGVVESQPGLYVLGLWFLSGFTSSLLGGVGRDAEHIAEQIAARSPRLQTLGGQDGQPTGAGGARRPGLPLRRGRDRPSGGDPAERDAGPASGSSRRRRTGATARGT